MQTAITCSVILIAWLLLLGFSVSMGRARWSMFSGAPGKADHPLQKRIRAHGNAAEYIPALCLLFLCAAYVAPFPWVEWLIIATTIGPIIQAAGLTIPPSMDHTNGIRFIGSMSTYLLGTSLVIVILLSNARFLTP